jgi:hypothetical protein
MGAVESGVDSEAGSLRSPIRDNSDVLGVGSPISENHALMSSDSRSVHIDEVAHARHLSTLYRDSQIAQAILQELANTANLGSVHSLFTPCSLLNEMLILFFFFFLTLHLSADTDSVYSLEAQRRTAHGDKQKRISFWGQLRVLSARTFTNLYRDPFLLIAHVGVSLVLGGKFGKS